MRPVITACNVSGGRPAGRLNEPDNACFKPYDRPQPRRMPTAEPTRPTTTASTITEPRIWRRLELPGDLTLDAVHTLLQAAMGWSDSHLHRFSPGAGNAYESPYFVTEFDEEEGEEGTREDDVRLDQVLRARGDQLTYLYDFGDGWEHRVTLESTVPLTPENRQPRCVAGERACPLEDVGGIWGHHELAAWVRAGAPADALPGPPGTSTMSGEGVSSKACVAPIASTPESATTGPGSCATKRMSAPGSPRSTS